jgi:integrase
MPKSKLSKSSIEALPFAKPGGSYYQMDSEVPGFGIRVYPTRKVYIVRYCGKPYEIGDVRLIPSLDQARSDARRRKMRLEQGEGPVIASLFLEEARGVLAPDLFEAVMGAAQGRFMAAGGVVSEVQRVTRRTLGELAEKTKAYYRERRTCVPTMRHDCSRWDQVIVPALGGPSRALRDISQEDVERMIAPFRDRPTAANRLVDLLHWALRKVSMVRPPWLLPHELPTNGIERYSTHPRKRPFTEEELPKIWGALIACRRMQRCSPLTLDLCELILLTGCRPGEPLAAVPSWVEILPDESAGTIRLPEAKGDRPGREKGRAIYLGAEGVAIIQRRLRAMKPDNPHLFPGRKPGSHLHYEAVWYGFQQIFALAEIKDRVPYSARHTYVSEGEDAGIVLTDMKDLAGHRSVTTTDTHYRSSKTRRLLAAAQQMSQHLAGFAVAGEATARAITERFAATNAAPPEGFVPLAEESHPRES